MTKKAFVMLIVLLNMLMYSQGVRIDMSTGVTGDFSGVLTPVGTNDDTWIVQFPSTSTFVNVPVSSGAIQSPSNIVNPTTWQSQGCARWLSPVIHTNGNALYAPAENYVYRMGFFGTDNLCKLGPQHRIHFDFIGSDNSITSIKFNSTNYPITPVPSFNPLTSNVDIFLNPTDFVNGINIIEITVNNIGGWTGLYVCGYLEYFPNGTMSNINITGPTNFCYNNPITLNGSITGNAISHQWHISECDASGNNTAGGYFFSSGIISGNPSSYTFPGPNVLPCNRYYKVKLITTGGCPIQSIFTTKIICVSCNNPSFSLSNNTSNPLYYTMTAIPNVQAPYGPCGNFGYAWYVEELIGGNPVFLINNPSNWWTFTSNNVGFVNHFRGVDCTINNYSGTINSLLSTPTFGRFLYGRTYRITRGTWVSTGVCNWQQQSQIITVTPAGGSGAGSAPGGADNYIVDIEEDFDAPDFSELFYSYYNELTDIYIENTNWSSILIYPNPNSGEFNIRIKSKLTIESKFSVVDLSGRVVHTQPISLQEGENIFQISKPEIPAGVYFIRVDGIDENIKMVVTE